jgi:hypothetical protein
VTSRKQQPADAGPVFVHDFFDTSGMADFTLKDVGPEPEGYPKPSPDTYCSRPFAATYEGRRRALIDHCLKNPAGKNIKGYYYELVRIAEGKGPVHESWIEAA